jgi:hypothetical protein
MNDRDSLGRAMADNGILVVLSGLSITLPELLGSALE